jgi:hypothetical protein
LVNSIEEETEILFIFKDGLGVFLEFGEVDNFGVNSIKDLAEMDAICKLFKLVDFGLNDKTSTLVISLSQLMSSAREGRLNNIKQLYSH